MAEEKQKTVGEVADELIHGDRAKFYGHPSVNLNAIGEAWAAYLRAKLAYVLADVPRKEEATDDRAATLYLDDVESAAGRLEVSAHDVCELMILLKAVRGAKGYHRDSEVDTVGYALLDAVVSGDDPY